MGSRSKKDIVDLVIFQRSYDLYLRDRETERDEGLSWVPPVDIYETDDGYVLKAELPGVERKDLRIEITNSELTIRGERRFDAVCAEENYYRLEGIRGRFHRRFSLPEPLNTEEIRANLKDGVLEVILPKLNRQVTVQSPAPSQGRRD